jgi:CheY-like chemotaxis protein
MAHHLRDNAETVLIIDDDDAIREVEVMLLSQLGYNVLQADGPAGAMRLAAATPTIDLLLTDFSMPGANGLELTEQFRAVHPRTPVLMVSASLAIINRQDDHLDQFGVLAKPFTPEELARKVRASLNDALDK